MRESIARFDERAAANTMLGMMIQEWKNVFKNRPSVAEKIENMDMIVKHCIKLLE